MPRIVKTVLLSSLIAVGIFLVHNNIDRFETESLTLWLESFGMAGPAVFVLIYAAATVLFLPGTLLTLAGGALFGPLWGTLLNIIGATLGATLAFLISRHLAADLVARKAAGRLRQLIDGVEQEGWRFVAFTRLVPLFPFNLLNYALGLTRIPLLQYILASAIFMLPGAFAYTWLGYAGREAAVGSEGLIQKVIIALALLAAVAFLPRFITRLRQKPWLEIDELRNRVAVQQGLVLDVRTEKEYTGEQGHIEGARNIPLESLGVRLDELGEDRQQAIAIVCRTDRRSASAADLLMRQGFTDARVVRGGMTAWLERGWDVSREA